MAFSVLYRRRLLRRCILAYSLTGVCWGVAAGPQASAQSNGTANVAASAEGVLPVVTSALSLSDALRLAEQSNVQLAQVTASSKAAQADVERANAALSPSLSATAYATAGNESSIVSSSPGVMPQNIFAVPRQGFADQDLMLMVPLYTGGSLQKRRSGAASQSRGASLDVAANRLQIRQMTVQAYTSVLLQNELLATARSRVAAEQEQVRITREKVDTGRLAPVDLLREQAELADAQSGIVQANTDYESALIDLKTDLGVSQTSTITLKDTLDTLETSETTSFPITLSAAIQIAVKYRPELAAAQERVNAAMAQVSAAHGQYAPQVYAIGMADAAAGQEMRGQTGFTVGISASVPLYDGGARKADADAAAASLDRAREDARAARLAVERNVAQAWFALQTARQQATSSQAGLAAAQQGYSLADLRYNAGKSTTAERLDALEALTRASGAIAQAKAALVNAVEALRSAEDIAPM